MMLLIVEVFRVQCTYVLQGHLQSHPSQFGLGLHQSLVVTTFAGKRVLLALLGEGGGSKYFVFCMGDAAHI